jgi:hypothetical protein
MKPTFAPAALLCALAMAGPACHDIECGSGTIQRGDQCVADSTQPGDECGPGTTLDRSSGRCVDNLFLDGGGVCGQNTVQVVDDAGNRTCVGTGATDCASALPCAAPTDPNKVSVCGRIFDLEDSTPIDNGGGVTAATVELRLYDPIAFLQNPATAQLLVTPPPHPDACGRFALRDVTVPGDGFVSIATEDAGMVRDLYAPGAIALQAVAGHTYDGLRAWLFRRTTDQMWSTSAGVSPSFGTQGVWIPMYLAGSSLPPFDATPTRGVTIALKNPSTGLRQTDATRDFYFTDTNPLVRRSAGNSTSPTSTGANGTGLFINLPYPPSTGSGTGAEPSGLCWAFDLTASPPGGAFVQEKPAGTVNCQ